MCILVDKCFSACTEAHKLFINIHYKYRTPSVVCSVCHFMWSLYIIIDLKLVIPRVPQNQRHHSLDKRDLEDTYCLRSCEQTQRYCVQHLRVFPLICGFALHSGSGHQTSRGLYALYGKHLLMKWLSCLASFAIVWRWIGTINCCISIVLELLNEYIHCNLHPIFVMRCASWVNQFYGTIKLSEVLLKKV